MFTSIEVLIGLALVYLILAFIVTALTEWVASGFRLRSLNMNKALRRMLSDQNVHAFLTHPRVQTLSDGNKAPTFISPKAFAEVLIALTTAVDQGSGQTQPGPQQPRPTVDPNSVPLLAGQPSSTGATQQQIEERFLDTMNVRSLGGSGARVALFGLLEDMPGIGLSNVQRYCFCQVEAGVPD